MLVRNPNFVPSSTADIAVLTSYINPIAGASFDQIRLDVVPLSNKTDAELHQIAVDSGFIVEGD